MSDIASKAISELRGIFSESGPGSRRLIEVHDIMANVFTKNHAAWKDSVEPYARQHAKTPGRSSWVKKEVECMAIDLIRVCAKGLLNQLMILVDSGCEDLLAVEWDREIDPEPPMAHTLAERVLSDLENGEDCAPNAVIAVRAMWDLEYMTGCIEELYEDSFTLYARSFRELSRIERKPNFERIRRVAHVALVGVLESFRRDVKLSCINGEWRFKGQREGEDLWMICQPHRTDQLWPELVERIKTEIWGLVLQTNRTYWGSMWGRTRDHRMVGPHRNICGWTINKRWELYKTMDLPRG